MTNKNLAIRIVVSLLAVASSACTVVPGLDLTADSENVGAPVHLGGYDLISVTPETVQDLLGEGDWIFDSPKSIELAADAYSYASEYLVGPGDVLTIIVWDHPELTSPTGEFRDPESAGRLVGANGKIFYPYIGELEVAGLPVSSIRRLIAARLARVVRDPQVDVRVASFRSQRVKVTGDVVTPTIVPITDRGLSIVEAITSAGGLSETASRRLAILTRDGRDYSIDLRGYSEGTGFHGDIALKHGDIIRVPNSDEYSIYMLGAVSNQTSIALPKGWISLAEALSRVEGINEETGDRSKVYILRADRAVDREPSSLPGFKAYLVNLSNVGSLILSDHIKLQPGDVIYVDRTGLATYNTVISQILPTVSTLFQLDRLVAD